MKNLRSGKLYDNGVNYKSVEEVPIPSEQKLGAEEEARAEQERKREEKSEKQP